MCDSGNVRRTKSGCRITSLKSNLSDDFIIHSFGSVYIPFHMHMDSFILFF